jgi:hypothetical protein
LADEKDVDKIEALPKTYQVLDADSSQRVSIEYAVRGQSFVMKVRQAQEKPDNCKHNR